MYIAIDGDDSGRKIAACFINNDQEGLAEISQRLKQAAADVSEFLISNGFKIIFCAADGVTATHTDRAQDYVALFQSIQSLSPHNMTFSAGVGSNLQEAYIALLDAKSSGKNRLSAYSEIAQRRAS
jgi:hypothetical protein